MPLSAGTGKFELRPITPHKTVAGVLNTLRTFLQGKGWTILTDRIAQNPAFFTATADRATGFSGDNPIIKVNASLVGTLVTLSVDVFEAWVAGEATTTGTNQATVTGQGMVALDTTLDSDLWVSVGPGTFFLMTSYIKKATADGYYGVIGMSTITRNAGDNDGGCFYGLVGPALFNTTKTLYVPKLWDGSVAANAAFSVNTRLGGTDNKGLYGVTEAGKHAIFPLIPSKASLGRMKGKLNGVATCTYGYELAPGMLLPSVASPEWLVTKMSTDLKFSMLMAVTTPIEVLAPSLT